MIEVKPPKHSDALLGAVEATLKSHQLRLKPGQTLAAVVESITSRGFKLSAEHGYLDVSQTVAGAEIPCHVNSVFEGLAAQEPDRFFPRNVGGVTARDQLDRQGRVQYIRENGLEKYTALPTTGNPNLPTVLSSDMTRAEYLALDRTTKAALCGEFGAAAIGRILNRK